MSRQYDEYLTNHIQNVQKAADWMVEHEIVTEGLAYIVQGLVRNHDKSKYDQQEYYAYDEYFYGKGKEDPETKEEFNYAWLHHIRNNPHHWQY